MPGNSSGCSTCGAVIDDPQAHARWHDDLDRRLDAIEGKADHAQRDAKRKS